MNELSWLEINLSRLEQNLGWWRRLLGCAQGRHEGQQESQVRSQYDAQADGDSAAPAREVRVCAVVKANAYGLGAVAIAQRLAQADVDMLAVYSAAQAEELLEAGLHRPILVLMPTRELDDTPAVRQAAGEGRVHLTVNDPGQLDLIAQLGRSLGARLPIHLHLDTGMSRAGLSSEELDQILASLALTPQVRLAGIFSHLAAASDDGAFDNAQLDRFEQAVAANRRFIGPHVLQHIAATCGVCRGRRYHKNMVRIGIGLYGYGPRQMLNVPPLFDPSGLQGVLRWLGRIIHIQRYAAGTPVGYGCTHRLSRDSVLGVVPVGYADGYPLALSNVGRVRVLDAGAVGTACGGLAPVCGRVSMDQIIIDLTDLPAARLGGLVELVSSDPDSPVALERLAEQADSTCYELLCRLSPRLARQYVNVETTVAAASVRVPMPTTPDR